MKWKKKSRCGTKTRSSDYQHPWHRRQQQHMQKITLTSFLFVAGVYFRSFFLYGSAGAVQCFDTHSKWKSRWKKNRIEWVFPSRTPPLTNRRRRRIYKRIPYICSIIIYERSNFLFSLLLVTSCKQIFCIYWLVLDTSYTSHAACAHIVSGVRRRFFTFLFIYSFFSFVSALARSLLLTATSSAHGIWSRTADSICEPKNTKIKIETKSWDTKSSSSDGGVVGNSKCRKCLTIELPSARSRVIDIRGVGVGKDKVCYACMFQNRERERKQKFDASTYGAPSLNTHTRNSHLRRAMIKAQSSRSEKWKYFIPKKRNLKHLNIWYMVLGAGAWRACCLAPLVAAVCCHQIDMMSFLSVSAFYIFIYSSAFCVSLLFFFATQTNTHWYTIIMTKQQRRKHSHTHEHNLVWLNTFEHFQYMLWIRTSSSNCCCNSNIYWKFSHANATPMPIQDALLSFDFVERDKLWCVERVSRNSINWVCAHANTFYILLFPRFFSIYSLYIVNRIAFATDDSVANQNKFTILIWDRRWNEFF